MKPLDPYTPDGFHRLLFSSIVGAKSGEPIVPEKREAMSKEKRQWLRHVLETVYTLYGSAPMTVFQQVYEQCGQYGKTALELVQQLQQLPEEEKDFVLAHGEVYAHTLDADAAAALVWQRRNVPFFIPPKAVIDHADLGMIAFVPRDRLEQTLSDLLDITIVSETEVLTLWQSALMMLAAGEEISHIVTAAANLHFVTSPREIKQLEGILAMWNDIVPKWRNAGHSDEALHRMNVL